MSDTLPTCSVSVPLRAPSIEELSPLFPQLDLLEFIGRGGMGLVYKARQKSLDRLVALKLLAPAQEHEKAFAERFAIEARALAALDHPNIVTVYDFGETAGACYLLMEYMDGVNLRQAMRADRITPEQALAIVPPICEALEYAHERGIVHRDIKPENLLMNKEGKVKIADFGIAKIVAQPEAAASAGADTAGGRVTFVGGTPEYMAPEQKRGPGGADHRVDIYSLGVVLYELLTGELPKAKLEAPSHKVQLDVRLDQVVLRALEKSPELRFQTAGEMRTQLATVAQAAPREKEPAAAPRKRIRPLTVLRRSIPLAVLVLGLPWLGVFLMRAKIGTRQGPRHWMESLQIPNPATAGGPGQGIKVETTFAAEGATEMTKSYIPLRLVWTETRPREITKLPEGIPAPLFGQIKTGPAEAPATVNVMMKFYPNQGSRLWVDGNANGDLTDDPAPEWKNQPSKTAAIPDAVTGAGYAWIQLPHGPAMARARMDFYAPPYSFSDPKTPSLLYHPEYFRTAHIIIDDMPMIFLIKDADGDGDFRTRLEFVTRARDRMGRVTQLPMQKNPLSVEVDGRLYEIRNMSASGETFEWILSTGAAGRSGSTVASRKPSLARASLAGELKGPFNLAAGAAAPGFAATTLTGRQIFMPQSFRGKVLLIEFWATWCGPCLTQIPQLKETYRQYRELGLEILGVSLDEGEELEKLRQFVLTHEMPWPQICEGNGWRGLVTRMYNVNALPSAVLIDGDTGRILAVNPKGEELEEAIRSAIGAKRVNPTS